MTIATLLRSKTILFAFCLGAAPVACSVEDDDDDDDGAGDVDVDVDDDDGDDDDELVSCQADCADGDDACLESCEVEFVS
ncbi:MAG TPA: hypothetical protein VFG69_14550 [Nannocystaceae bacterium]|nr:hypothetical protein [Nannocystaceae bacterium]